MLTRREVLDELKRLGMETPSLLKIAVRDFERYMGANHGLKIVKNRKGEYISSFQIEIEKPESLAKAD